MENKTEEKLKASVDNEGVITFDKVLDIKDRIIFLFLLCEQAKITLQEVKVSKNLYEPNKKWFVNFKKELKANHLGTEFRQSDSESNELILKVKI